MPFLGFMQNFKIFFLQNMPDESAYTLRGQKFLQNGCQKWRENDFWQKVANDSIYILQVKNFVENCSVCIVSEINAFLHFTQKFKIATKNCGNRIWGTKSGRYYTDIQNGCQSVAGKRLSAKIGR